MKAADHKLVREFATGATRSSSEGKPQYEGFLSPLVILRFGQYMEKHRIQADGKSREADNWQKGMPPDSYIDSGFRHFVDWWLHHRGYGEKATESLEESLCAIIFNAQGYLHGLLTEQYTTGEETSCVPHREPSKPSNPVDCISDKVLGFRGL